MGNAVDRLRGETALVVRRYGMEKDMEKDIDAAVLHGPEARFADVTHVAVSSAAGWQGFCTGPSRTSCREELDETLDGRYLFLVRPGRMLSAR